MLSDFGNYADEILLGLFGCAGLDMNGMRLRTTVTESQTLCRLSVLVLDFLDIPTSSAHTSYSDGTGC